MRSRYKAAFAGLCLIGIACTLLFRSTAATAAPPTAIPFTFVTVDVPVPGAGSTQLVGINNRGDVVGSYNFLSGLGKFGIPAPFLGKGFAWYRDGSFTTIDGPGPGPHAELCNPLAGSFQNCYYMEARGINEQGDIVGTFSQDVFN